MTVYLPSSDGLKWFNLLYLKVTQQVETHPPPDGWENPLWLTRLDVVFAGKNGLQEPVNGFEVAVLRTPLERNNVRAARDLAWDFADNLRPLSGIARNVALATQDQVTGVLGRSLLL